MNYKYVFAISNHDSEKLTKIGQKEKNVYTAQKHI